MPIQIETNFFVPTPFSGLLMPLPCYTSCLFCTNTTEGCKQEQATLEFDLPFGDVLPHKLVKTYQFKIFLYYSFNVQSSTLE